MIKNSKKNKSQKSIPKKQNDDNKPVWNDCINNLDKYKLTSADLIKRKINMISKNLMDAKKELNTNYQILTNSTSLIHDNKNKERTKSIDLTKRPPFVPNKKGPLVKKEKTKYKSSHSKNKYQTQYDHKLEEIEKNEKDDDFIELKTVIPQHTKITKSINKYSSNHKEIKSSPKIDHDLYNLPKQNFADIRSNLNDPSNLFKSNAIEKKNTIVNNYSNEQEELSCEQLNEDNENEDEINNDDNQDQEENYEYIDDLVNKGENENEFERLHKLDSIEESMNKLNSIIEISSKNSLKNKYNYGVSENDNIEKMNINQEKINDSMSDYYHQNIDNLEKDLKALKEKFNFSDEPNNIPQKVDLSSYKSGVQTNLINNDQTKYYNNLQNSKLINSNIIIDDSIFADEPQPQSLIVNRRNDSLQSQLYNNNENHKINSFKIEQNTKNFQNDIKRIIVPTPVQFSEKNKSIKAPKYDDDNIEYIKNLLIQTDQDIKQMNLQLNGYCINKR